MQGAQPRCGDLGERAKVLAASAYAIATGRRPAIRASAAKQPWHHLGRAHKRHAITAFPNIAGWTRTRGAKLPRYRHWLSQRRGY
jgi:hypothetical protein